MTVLPLRFHPLDGDRMLCADDAGRAFIAGDRFVAAYAEGSLAADDHAFLAHHGFTFDGGDDLSLIGHLRALSDRTARPRALSYVILVPTLRCDLHCGYCQVSRVNADQRGFDWSDETLRDACAFLDDLEADELHVEFQGGEPLLRPDLLRAVIERCERRFRRCSFVICTNLSRLDDEVRALFDRDDVHVSTSLDGPPSIHERQRTHVPEATAQFFANLEEVVETWGADKISALPTIDYADPPPVSELVDAFERFGLRSIFLRPISHHGFARKAHGGLRDAAERWNAYHDAFVDHLIERIARGGEPFEEYYFSLILKRCLRGGVDQHVDLRTPNPYGHDYLVVDFDGRLYPTDEARMLTRAGRIDLSIGDIVRGVVNAAVLDALNAECFNAFDPDCVHCAFQPACGVDLLDDIARYGRRDLPRATTFFCRRHTHLFERAWRLLLSREPRTRRSVCHWLGVPYTDQDLIPIHDTARASMSA